MQQGEEVRGHYCCTFRSHLHIRDGESVWMDQGTRKGLQVPRLKGHLGVS